MTLAGKNIILGVTGSIAAYKATLLTRTLIKEGARVKVIMTPLAREFITPLTMATLSQNTVSVDFFEEQSGAWDSHVEHGVNADALLIAPATANTIAKMATGISDNLLLATYLSARCPVFIAPAMDMDMFSHPATVQNINILRGHGVYIIEPAEGELASGLEGKGRMEEPENIVKFLKQSLNTGDCKQLKILVTAGPTYEAIDPVRFVGNRSSGKMGFALAEELAQRGALVTLLSGPVSQRVKHPNISVINVCSAEEMYNAAVSTFPEVDAAIMSAAVADFKPETIKIEKIKEKKINLKLVPTKDIAAELGAMKRANQILVGFALEIENEIENAKNKLVKKNFDFIVLNSLNDAGAGFGYDTNKITIIDKKKQITHFSLKSKRESAKDIVDKLVACMKRC